MRSKPGVSDLKTIVLALLCSLSAFATAAQQTVAIPEILTPKVEKMVDVRDRNLHCSIYGSTPATAPA